MTDAATAATTAAATTATAAAATAAATTTAAAAPAWTDGLDAGTTAFVTERGWKGPGDVLTSYRNLEKLTGAPAEQIIKLPKDMNDATMGEVWTRLGKPAAPADYKLETIAGSDPEFSKAAAGWFHAAGAPVGMAQKVVTELNKHVAARVEADTKAYTAKVAADTIALKTAWGQAYDSNVEIAKTATKSFGITAEQMGTLEQVMGFAGVHKLFFNIGSKLGEAEFVQGGGKSGDFSGMTVESARAKIIELKKSSTFIAKWNSSDPTVRGEARAEMQRYEKVAYPGQQVI